MMILGTDVYLTDLYENISLVLNLKSMKKWEYWFIDKEIDNGTIVEDLNMYGDKGWELVSSTPIATHTVRYTFKREIKQE